MTRLFYILLHLLRDGFQARRDAHIRFLHVQIDVLRRKLDQNRVILSPEDRAHLLRIGGELGHDVKDILGIVAHQTYRRWIREQQNGRKARRVGRPRIGTVRRQLIVRFAKENIGWGYRRIVGELAKLHLPVGRSTIRRILHDEGLFPRPVHGCGMGAETPWRKFLRLHMNTLVACDFFTKSVITPLCIKTAYCLFFIHLGTRKVFLCPATYHPQERWVMQQARNVQMWFDDQGVEARFLLRDRDTKLTAAFDQLFRDAGTRIVKTPVKAPNANAYAESWVGSLKRECLNYFVCFGLGHLNHILGEYVYFFNRYRPHQGLGNRPLSIAVGEKGDVAAARRDDEPDDEGAVRCQRFLGGLLRHYYRGAA